MSHPDSWPRQRDLEEVLRRELRMVAESVRPAADGLDRIRSRIREQRPAPFGWTMAGSAGFAEPGRLSVRDLLPFHRALQAFLYTGMHRFGPSDHRMTWHRWLRPMAALATVVFVVLAGSWAVTALPHITASSGSSPTGGGAGRVPLGSGSDSTGPKADRNIPSRGPGNRIRQPSHNGAIATPREAAAHLPRAAATEQLDVGWADGERAYWSPSSITERWVGAPVQAQGRSPVVTSACPHEVSSVQQSHDWRAAGEAVAAGPGVTAPLSRPAGTATCDHRTLGYATPRSCPARKAAPAPTGYSRASTRASRSSRRCPRS
jgi:hypothetical protein